MLLLITSEVVWIEVSDVSDNDSQAMFPACQNNRFLTFIQTLEMLK